MTIRLARTVKWEGENHFRRSFFVRNTAQALSKKNKLIVQAFGFACWNSAKKTSVVLTA